MKPRGPSPWPGKAEFSMDRLYRYRLERIGVSRSAARTVTFLLLNPSVATETTDDNTVRRCLGYAMRWDYARLLVLNIFAFRSTDPAALYQVADPIGPKNDAAIRKAARESDLVVCGWGNHGTFLGRGETVRSMLAAPHVLAMTKSGQPGHPLYLRADLVPRPW